MESGEGFRCRWISLCVFHIIVVLHKPFQQMGETKHAHLRERGLDDQRGPLFVRLVLFGFVSLVDGGNLLENESLHLTQKQGC